jgi:RNA polymerase sigma factor (sigma-70 family)
VLQGNTAMFELLMRRYNERVYRTARAIVRDEQEAEDVMQQAYVNAFTHLRQFNGSAQFSTWLTRIAVNEALARVRRQADTRPTTTNSRMWSRSMSANHREPRATGIHRRAARSAGAGDRHALGRHARGVRAREVEGLSTVGSLRVPRRLGGRGQDPLVAQPAALRRVMLERTGAPRRTLPVRTSSMRPRRGAVLVTIAQQQP